MRAPKAPAAEFPNDNPELHDGAIWTSAEPGGALEPEIADCVLDAIAPALPPVAPAAPAAEIAEVAPIAEVAEVAEVSEAAEIAEVEVAARAPSPPPPLASGFFDVVDAAEPEAVEDPAEATVPAPPVVAHGAPPADDAEPEPAPEDAFTWLLRALSSCAVEAGVLLDLEDLEMLLCMGRVDTASLPPGAADALVAGGLADVVDDELVARPQLVSTARAWRRVILGEDEELGACGAAMLDEWCADLLARLLGQPQRADTLRRELRRRGVAAFGVLLDAA